MADAFSKDSGGIGTSMKKLLPHMAMSLGIAILTVSVGWLDFSFERPALSVRPQVWLSSPVEWTFRTQALLSAVSKGEEANEVSLTFSDFEQFADRFKNQSSEPMWSPIQSEVLLNTLSEMSLTSLGLRLSIPADATVVDFGSSIVAPEISDDRGVIAVRSPLSIDQLSSAIDQRVTLEVIVFVDRCAPRESRVFCPLADFAGADLRRGDFERANLRGTDITGVMFNDAKLGFADLSGAIGSDVDMSSAWLVGIDISDAFLKDVRYKGAVWTR